MPSRLKLSAVREEDYAAVLSSYFEESEDARRQAGFVLPPSIDDIKYLLPLGGGYKIVDAAGRGSNIRGLVRVHSRPGKTGPKVNVRFFLDDLELIREVYPMIVEFAKSETKLVIEAYSVFGYEKEKIEILLDLGFTKGAATLDTACLNGKYYDTHYLYHDLQKEYQVAPIRKYAEEGDLYPLLPIKRQRRPLKLGFHMVTPEDAGDLAESVSHQNTFRTIADGVYEGFRTKSESASSIEQGKKSGLVYSIVCADQERNKTIGISSVHIMPGHVSSHVGDIGIHVNAQYHGLGVGTSLFREIDVLAKRLHLQSLVLSYLETNEAGKKLYEKTGFEHRGEVPGWLSSRYVKEIYMQRML